jgi:hypothetical protein
MSRRVALFVSGLAVGALSVLLPLVFVVRAQDSERSRSPHGDLAGDCATCHTSEGWTPLRDPLPFDHRGTGFPLVAAHAQAGCRDCHQSLVFAHVATACADCHRDAHRGELGPRCESCHGVESWTSRREFARVHNRTRFPLLAAHAALDCESCHRGQQPREFVSTPTACASCHLADFQAAKNPDHVRLGFPRECEGCHSVASSNWRGGAFGANFPHPASFPLTGAHARTPCASCHVGSRFAGTSRDCVSCHRADFDRATNPNHRAAGFPTDCASCHATSAFRPASFDHERFFPIASGEHAGIPCATCHVSPANFRAFDCTSCHRRERMDDEHDDVRGYQYQSPACYRCHPRGRE